MKINTELRLADAAWDAYRAFHWDVRQNRVRSASKWNSNQAFVAFETGEVVWAGYWRPRPHLRGFYSTLGVSVLSPRDQDFPRMYHPETGDPVAKDWLIKDCRAYLLLDNATETAVSLEGCELKDVPTRFGGYTAKAYFAGEGRTPAGGGVKLSKPFTSLPKDQRQHINEIIKQCKAARAMAEAAGTYEGRYTYRWTPLPSIQTLLEAENYSFLTDEQRVNLLGRGIARIAETAPCLKFKA